jgi:hypothetical protein
MSAHHRDPRPPRTLRRSVLGLGLLVSSLAAPAAFAQDIQGSHRFGHIAQPAPHTGVQLLRSFWFRYHDGDHHVAAIGVTPDSPAPGQAGLIFQDKDPDEGWFGDGDDGKDEYQFHIQYQDVPAAGIFTGSFGREVCRKSCTYPIARPAGDNVFVVRGFYIYFQGTDHHLKRFGMWEENGNLTVVFHDQDTTGNDDNFIVEVQYAYVPRALFASMGQVAGVNARGGVTQAIPAGISVIRGFDFVFRSSDHHIEELGVFQPGNGRTDAYFNDHNDDDAFDWAVDWAVLRPPGRVVGWPLPPVGGVLR